MEACESTQVQIKHVDSKFRKENEKKKKNYEHFINSWQTHASEKSF